MGKTKIAIFDLAGCQGCEFHLLSLNESLLDFFQDFEITNWRLLSEKEKADFDIAFLEGAVTTQEQIKLLKKIRETSKIVIAFGNCAISGNIFAKISPEKRKKLSQKIYNKNYKLRAKFLEPVGKFIKIDEKIPGCPPDIEFLKKVLLKLKKKKIVSKIKEILPPDFTAKIEGHGILKINFKEKKVKFEVKESERLVEGLLFGKDFKLAPFFTSRICGICPIAHNICSLSAIENALGIEIKREIKILRRILLAGQIIKSHLLHLFFLVLPDYAKVKSSIDLSKKYPAEFHLMLNLKRLAERILKTIGGSIAFPTNTEIGGFKNPPKIDEILAIKSEIFEILDEAEDLVKLFANLKVPKLTLKQNFATSNPLEDTYPLYPANFSGSIKEIIKKDSPAKFGVLKNGEILKVGALARISKYSENLSLRAKKLFQKLKIELRNPFNNNLAQAIEILHFLEETIGLIDEISKNPDFLNLPQKLPEKTIFGQAVLEAPRGILIHQVKINQKGEIVNYNIITPTQINLASLEREAKEIVKNQDKINSQKIKKEIEKLIRAFDPCITCAVH